jgi:peptide/nickel transport system permease protein
MSSTVEQTVPSPADQPNTNQGIASLAVTKESRSLTQLALRRLRRDYLTLFSGLVIIALTALAIAAPLFESTFLPEGDDFKSTDTSIKYLPINSEDHVLGTDNLGRDHFIRVLYGGRISLGIGFGAAILSLMIGMSVGVIAGYNQGAYPLGFIDDALMWFVTTLNSIPQLFLLIIVASVFITQRPPVIDRVISETGIPDEYIQVVIIILVLALLSWTDTMRLVRGETLSQRSREYVVAAQAVGASSRRIMFTHIIPNIFSVLTVSLAINIGGLILTEAGLSFLGLGIQEPIPSWGNMLTKSQEFFRESPHLSIIPGLLITITVLCLYVIGDGLRDAFDPQASKKL